MLKRFFFPVLFLLIILGGFAIRIYDVQDAPLDYHATRQLHSALIARGMYYASLPSDQYNSWERSEAIRQQQLEGIIEPPIMEWLASRAYLLSGAAQLWIPRVIAIIFWLLAAIGIALLALDWIGKAGAITALGFFLFYPYGVAASRSFQPESLLMAVLVWAVWALMRWQRSGAWKWAIVVGVLGGMALLIKAVSVFFLIGAWVLVTLIQPEWKKTITSAQFWVSGGLIALPNLMYTFYGIFGSGSLTGQFGMRFFPAYWTDISFYVRWFLTLRKVVAVEWLLIGAVGWLLLESGLLKRLLTGLWIGYLILGFTLSYHITTHDYYSLSVFIMVSLGAGALTERIWKTTEDKFKRSVFCILLLFTFLIFGYDAYSAMKRIDFGEEIAFWAAMGEKLGRNARVTALVEDYGYRLEYWGWLTPTAWMSGGDFSVRADSGSPVAFEPYFIETTEGRDYFLITDLNEFEKQVYLKQKLEGHYALLEKTERYLLYDLKDVLQ